ncbi:MAG: PPOX class F420-dependent oxidoreductase [Chloroflexales bacterium]|nr:PPOX class F420-dependent oxidoreductase [Chloroflexales bacterium]
MAFENLQSQQFMNLITYRKSGQTVRTPVWFVQEEACLYVMTGKDAGKIKRIRNNPTIVVEPSDRTGKSLGPELAAQAHLITDPVIAAHASSLLNKKYGFMKRIFDFMAMFSGGLKNRAYIVITPAE